MKISVTELRNIVAETVSRVLAEAPKKGSKRPPKEVPPRSEEAELEQRDRHVRGLQGFAHSDVADFSRPLGPVNLYKKQGAANMGGWTAESVKQKIKELQIRKLVRMVVGEEVRARRGRR
jgi:hypothetical protein